MITTRSVVPADPIQKIMAVQLAEVAPEESLRSVAQELVADEIGAVAIRGELNVGQLIRERHPGDCRTIGFTTYTGTVTAADDWGRPAQRKWVRPALPDSIEELSHEVGEKEFFLAWCRHHCPR